MLSLGLPILQVPRLLFLLQSHVWHPTRGTQTYVLMQESHFLPTVYLSTQMHCPVLPSHVLFLEPVRLHLQSILRNKNVKYYLQYIEKFIIKENGGGKLVRVTFCFKFSDSRHPNKSIEHHFTDTEFGWGSTKLQNTPWKCGHIKKGRAICGVLLQS